MPFGNLSKNLYPRETDTDARTESGNVLCLGPESAPVEDLGNLGAEEKKSLHYVATLTSMPTFFNLLFFISIGLSFFHIDSAIARERAVFQDARKGIDFVNRREAALFMRLITVMGLRTISRIRESSWTYSVATDGVAQNMGTAYFSILVRVPPMHLEHDIHTLHLVAPPLRGSHTGDSMFNLTARVFDAVEPNWTRSYWELRLMARGIWVGLTSGGGLELKKPPWLVAKVYFGFFTTVLTSSK